MGNRVTTTYPQKKGWRLCSSVWGNTSIFMYIFPPSPGETPQKQGFRSKPRSVFTSLALRTLQKSQMSEAEVSEIVRQVGKLRLRPQILQQVNDRAGPLPAGPDPPQPDQDVRSLGGCWAPLTPLFIADPRRQMMGRGVW